MAYCFLVLLSICILLQFKLSVLMMEIFATFVYSWHFKASLLVKNMKKIINPEYIFLDVAHFGLMRKIIRQNPEVIIF